MLEGVGVGWTGMSGDARTGCGSCGSAWRQLLNCHNLSVVYGAPDDPPYCGLAEHRQSMCCSLAVAGLGTAFNVLSTCTISVCDVEGRYEWCCAVVRGVNQQAWLLIFVIATAFWRIVY